METFKCGVFCVILANSTNICYIYSKLISRTGTSDVIFGYNGRDGVVTDKNGLIYMRARYYSPEMRRFVNADILAGTITNAITLNRYAYANGNPVSFVDPLGLYICQSCGDAGCKICLDEDTLFKVLSGEIPNPNKQASSSNSGSSKSGGSVSTCFDDDENGQVINKNDYYGVPATPNKPQKTTEDTDAWEQIYVKAIEEASDQAVDTTIDWTADKIDELYGFNNFLTPNKIAPSTYLKGANKAFSVFDAIYDVMYGANQNYQNGEPWGEIVTDGALDIGSALIPLGAQKGTTWLVGSVAASFVSPGVGTIIGLAAFALSGIAYDVWVKPYLDDLM